jgi:isopenicillin N synthase-like dioxygenase
MLSVAVGSTARAASRMAVTSSMRRAFVPLTTSIAATIGKNLQRNSCRTVLAKRTLSTASSVAVQTNRAVAVRKPVCSGAISRQVTLRSSQPLLLQKRYQHAMSSVGTAKKTAVPLSHPVMSRSASSAASFEAGAIPTIDISPFLNGGEAGKLEVAKQINDAAEQIGFFTVVGHGVPKNVISEMTSTTKEFFDQPLSVKNHEHVRMNLPDYPYGYQGVLEENLGRGYGEESAPADLKECFAIGPYNPAAGMMPNHWPSAPAAMPDVWLRYYKRLEVLASDILRIFALSLDLPEGWFEDKIDHHRSALRALNYPEWDKPIEEGQFRAGAHTDYGSITILMQDSTGGLQVQNRQQEWQDVPYIDGSFIINLGDLMSRWTNDKWVSTLHRVKHSVPRRQSVAFFHNINHDHLVECFDSCVSADNPAKYPPILAWDHLMQKHHESSY